MINLRSGDPDTEHNDSPVPLVVVSQPGKIKAQLNLGRGALSDIAPTILAIAGIQKPTSMSGKSLLR